LGTERLVGGEVLDEREVVDEHLFAAAPDSATQTLYRQLMGSRPFV
jgi:hypothetical protein